MPSLGVPDGGEPEPLEGGRDLGMAGHVGPLGVADFVESHLEGFRAPGSSQVGELHVEGTHHVLAVAVSRSVV